MNPRNGSVVAALLVVLLTACSTDDTYLPALLEDPMAGYEAGGIVVFDSWKQAERPGFMGGKPTHAEVGRRYRILDQGQVESVLEAAVAAAEAAGWRMQQESDFRHSGARELPGEMGGSW